MCIYNYICNVIYDKIVPDSPLFDELEITMDKVIIDNPDDVVVFPVKSVNSGRGHVWLLDSDIIFPNAYYGVKYNKDRINYDDNVVLSIGQIFYIYCNRIMNMFAIIPVV